MTIERDKIDAKKENSFEAMKDIKILVAKINQSISKEDFEEANKGLKELKEETNHAIKLVK